MRLLLAEDEERLSQALVEILRHHRYEVEAVRDGKEALAFAESGGYDGIVLDIMMPKMDGVSVLRSLRSQGITTPVLLLSARAEVEDRITGLDAGADDYLTKPFSSDELLARIRAMTRRGGDFTPNLLHYGNIALERESFELSVGDRSQRLSSKEFQMLEMLMLHPNRLISTEQFMEKIWGFNSDTELGVVWVYISYLRKKLTTLGADVEIKAARGVGYSLEIKNRESAQR